MPFSVPTLQQIASQVHGLFRSNMKGSDAALWPNNVAVSAKVIAAGLQGAYSFQDYIAKQILPSTAEDQFLIRHAAARGLAQLAPSYATGNALFHGTVSTVIPAGTQVQRLDGVQYETLTDGTTDSGTGYVSIPVRALLPGKAGNALADVILNLVAPVTGIDTENAVDTSGIGAGADLESIESLRARLLFVLQNPPHGGAQHDYVIWASQVNGVTRVYVDPITLTNARTTIGLWFMMDDSYTDGVPQPADVTVVGAYIDALRPAGAIVEVAAPTPNVVNIVITGMTPNTLAIRNAVTAELVELFRRATAVSTVSAPFTLYRSIIQEAIAVALGEHNFVLTTPASDTLYTTGHIPTLGTVTFA